MFDIIKFGAYIAKLRKSADITQSEFGDKINVTRQAISKYERGESFPDISILLLIADEFGVSVESLIHAGEPTKSEAEILLYQSAGNNPSIDEIMNVAQFLKPSVLDRFTVKLKKQGIDISHLIALSEYMNSKSVAELLDNADINTVDGELLKRLVPVLPEESKTSIFARIINGELDWRFIEILLPYADYLASQVEAAVIEDALPWEALDVMRKAFKTIYEKEMYSMKKIFICPNCKCTINHPSCYCGYTVPAINNIYQFFNGEPYKLDGDDKYIGYDEIGDDFEPSVTYWDSNNTERYGVYEACGDIIARTFGTDIIVLDLGAGLGTASIPLAKNGIFTIAADISNTMLSTAVKRANSKYDNLVFIRMNAYNIPLEDNTVDIVIENAMLHLVDNPEKIIREIVRILKPTGMIVRYSSPGQHISDEERKINDNCNKILSDITNYYSVQLKSFGKEELWFDNNLNDIMVKYFKSPYNEVSDHTEIFTEKMKFRLHRLKTGAHSGFQGIEKDILKKCWELTDKYAKEKYGADYMEIPSFSRYGAAIDIYTVKP